MMREKIFPGWSLRLLVNSERSSHRTTNPYRSRGLSGPLPSTYGFWSHSSLRSRRGMELSATWPLLTGLFPAQLIPARPFGLRWRFDETPSGNASGPLIRALAPEVSNQSAKVKRNLAQNVNKVKAA